MLSKVEGLGKPKLYQNMWCFTRMWDFTWRVSDFEELVRVTTISEEFDSEIWNVFGGNLLGVLSDL